MEVLDALERKVAELLTEVSALRKRNAELEDIGAAAGQNESGRIAGLEEALRQERELREAVLQRISVLLRRLEDHDSAG